jgi:hypothetical protein
VAEVTTQKPANPEETVAWEERNRTWAIVAAVVGAVLPLIGLFVAPKPRTPQDIAPGDITSPLIYFHAHASEFVISQVVIAIGTIGTGIALLYLYRATKARRPQLQAAAKVLAIAGPILLGVAGIAGQLYLAQKSADFVKGPMTDPEADKILTSGVRVAVGSAGIAGQFALGFAFVMIALNAMRAGLLTRFMGVLGILVGVFPVLLSLLASTLAGVGGGGPAPIVQFFWLGALAYLISGRWPNGVPPAWKTGEAVPWPSSQELREQRQAQLEERRAAAGNRGSTAPARPSGGLLGMLFGGGQQRPAPQPAEAEPEPEPQPTTRPSPATSAKKRKRKKRNR